MSRLRKLGLGTVQWGLGYGVSNKQGMTPPEIVAQILVAAKEAGVEVLDTASLYGESERVLGANRLDGFRIVTKTPRFGTARITEANCTQLVQVFSQSLQKLACDKVYGLLCHHVEDLLVPGGDKLWDAMCRLKGDGRVEKIGVSVYDSHQVDRLLKKLRPDLIQLPVNVLDQRLLKDGTLARLHDAGVEIHVRSVFLQGLLLMPLEQVPSYFSPIRNLLESWHAAAKSQGLSLVQAALTFARDIPYIDTVLVGVENLEQFHACCNDFSHPSTFDASGLACDNPEFLNPALWKLA